MTSQSTPRPQVKLVISGGIGSGKSVVGARLRELGAVVVEADLVGHEVLEPGGPAYDDVVHEWPQVVRHGAIDRAALAEIVFTDAAALQRLEAITHPAIAEVIRRRVAEATAPVVAVELPVGSDLVGSGWLHLVVEAPEETRVERAVARGMDPADVRRRMAAQPTAEEWREGAQYVILNDGSLADLVAAVDDLWARLQPTPG